MYAHRARPGPMPGESLTEIGAMRNKLVSTCVMINPLLEHICIVFTHENASGWQTFR